MTVTNDEMDVSDSVARRLRRELFSDEFVDRLVASAGERGVSRQAEFLENLDVIVSIAARTGCVGFNALYGQRQPGMTTTEQDDLAVENLSLAIRRLATIGGTVLIEPLSRGLNGAHPIETARDAATVITRVRENTGLSNIGLLFDTFHMTNNGEDLHGIIGEYGEIIEHVQVADSPGRGEPGTGSIRFAEIFEHLGRAGYSKSIPCEYVPSVPTPASLGWIDGMPLVQLAPSVPGNVSDERTPKALGRWVM